MMKDNSWPTDINGAPKVFFKLMHDDACLPKKAHATDAGMDVCAHSFYEIIGGKVSRKHDLEYHLWPGERILVDCGFSMALPPGYEAQIRPRSGLALKHGITVVNSPGTIDSSWRGSVGVILLNTGTNIGMNSFTIKRGDRIAQMVVQKLTDFCVEQESGELPDPGERYDSGFGSSGV